MDPDQLVEDVVVEQRFGAQAKRDVTRYTYEPSRHGLTACSV